MALDQIVLGLNIGGCILALVATIFVAKQRDFEISIFENSMNALVFGFLFIFLIMVTNTLESLILSYGPTIAKSIPDVQTYLTYITATRDLAFAPLFAVCFLVSMYMAREALKNYPKLLKQQQAQETKPEEKKKKKVYTNF